MSDYPHVPAAFINAIREEGTKAEACDYLQEQWNETCALRAEKERLQHLSHCCVCGNPVDTREECDGGGPDGCQLTDDRWVCTSECWDKVVKTIDLQNELDRLRAENERLLGSLEEIKKQFSGVAGGHMAELLARAAIAKETGE